MNRAEILLRLKELPFDPAEYWLLAGGAMVLYGFREETADLDLGCSAALADRLESAGFLYRRTEDGKRWLKLNAQVELFEDWLEDRICSLDGVRVVSVTGLLESKRKLGREKDLRDIRQIREALAAGAIPPEWI